jgi:hypothetical protein
MIKKIFFVPAFLIISQLPAYPQAAQQCIVNNTAFSIGEKVFYKVAYNWNTLWVNAGEVSFTVNQGFFNNTPCYHMIGFGTTYRSYDWFYKVRDTYESFMDMQTMQPLHFIRNVSEGGYNINQNVVFKHKENKAVSTKGTYTIPDCIQDVLSAIYYARNIDFTKYKASDTIPVVLYLDDAVYHVYIRYLGKEQITTKREKFNCIKFRPLLIEGTIFKGGEEMTVWVTDDANKIPVRVESPILVGSVSAELYKYSGLRNPVTAKVD